MHVPGTSPFHVRGSTFLGMLEHLAARGRPLEDVLDRLPDDAHRAFARQVFLPVAWYDALLVPTMARAIAEVEGVPFADSIRARASAIANRDLTRLYRTLLKVVSPALVAERLQRAVTRYFDFGELEIVTSGGKHSECIQRAIPVDLVPWFQAMVSGYAPEVLKAAGARAPRVEFGPTRSTGELRGFVTSDLRMHLRWS